LCFGIIAKEVCIIFAPPKKQNWRSALVGDVILSLIYKRGLTVKEFSRQTGIARSSIHRYIKGTVTPGLKQILTMSRVLNVSPEVFFQKETPPQESVGCRDCLLMRRYEFLKSGVLFGVFSDKQSKFEVHTYQASKDCEINLEKIAKSFQGFLMADKELVGFGGQSVDAGKIYKFTPAKVAVVPKDSRVTFYVDNCNGISFAKILSENLSDVDTFSKIVVKNLHF